MSNVLNVSNAARPAPEYFSSIVPIPFPNLELFPEAVPQETIDSIPKEFANLMHRLFLTPSTVQRRTIAFLGCDETTGVRSVCANVARLVAFQTGEPVCLLDINEQRLTGPRLQDPNAAGSEFEEALLRPEAVRNLARNLGGNLWSLSAASTQTRKLSLLTAARFGALMTQVQSEFHYALIAAPPVVLEAASIPVCAVADATILVLGSTTRRVAALESMRLLSSMEIIVAGAVLEQQESHPIRG